MARLTRKNIKVFAGNATNNGVFGSLQAENPVTTTNVEQIQSLPAWSVGWNSATMTSEKLPPLEEFQGIQYVTTYQQAYLMQEGMPEWASTVTYYKGSLAKEVTSNGFRIYCSLTNDNTNNLLSDTSNWKKVMDSSDLYAYDSAVVHIAGAETITGAKTFTSDINVKDNIPAIYLCENDTVKGTNPQNEQIWAIYNQDSSNTLDDTSRLGIFTTHLATNGTVTTWMSAYKNEANSNAAATIKVSYPSSGDPYTTAPTPTDTTTTSGTQIATTGWVNSVGNNVVHLSGAETISGIKTFTSNVRVSKTVPCVDLYNTNITKGTVPSSLQWGRNAMLDKDGKLIAITQYQYNTAGETYAGIRAYSPNNETDYAQISIWYPPTGSPYTNAPRPTDTTTSNGTQIATTGWVNSVGNNVVHLSGSETIAGTKTFSSTISGSINGNAATVTNGVYTTGNQTIGGTKTFSAAPYVNLSQPRIYLKSSAVTKGNAPASNTEVGYVNFGDKDNAVLGRLRYFYDTNKDSVTQITAYQANSASDSNSASIGVKHPASGGGYGFAPASDVNGSIVTTVNKSKSSNGYFQLGNGMIVQWGSVTANNTVLTVTFPTSFTSTNYTVAGTAHNVGKALFISGGNKTKTNFKLDLGGGIGTATIDWLAIGY